MICPGVLMSDAIDVWIFLYIDIHASELYDINFFVYRDNEDCYFESLQLFDITRYRSGGWLGGKVIG